jgi:uncharacterized membrane protein YfcA
LLVSQYSPIESPAPDFALLVATTCVAALVVGFLRTSVGGGIGLVLTPTLSLVLAPSIVLAMIAPLMNLSDPLALRYYWRQWDRRQLLLLMPAMMAGVVVGTWALSQLSEYWLGKAIGAVALAFGVLQLVLIGRNQRLFSARPHWGAGAAAGLTAGVASTVAHSGGVVVSMYLVNVHLTKTAMLATGNALYVVPNALKLAGYWSIGFLTGPIIAAAALSVPLLIAGAWLGYRVNQRLPRRAFELLLVVIAIAGAVRLLVRS